MILKKVNWNIIYQNQSPELLALCVRYVKEKALAEDLLHDAFLTAIDKIDTLEGNSVEISGIRYTIGRTYIDEVKTRILNSSFNTNKNQ